MKVVFFVFIIISIAWMVFWSANPELIAPGQNDAHVVMKTNAASQAPQITPGQNDTHVVMKTGAASAMRLGPQITVNKRHFDLGTILAPSEMTHSFTFRNTGTGNLEMGKPKFNPG